MLQKTLYLFHVLHRPVTWYNVFKIKLNLPCPQKPQNKCVEESTFPQFVQYIVQIIKYSNVLESDNLSTSETDYEHFFI